MPKLLPQRISESLDVSGAFDNCFFHTYAIHILANKLPLPDDLFTFESIMGKQSHASKLQAKFPSAESLSLFAEYAKRHNPDIEPLSPNFIFEKTLVLGFLMREWFATKMSTNQEIRDEFKAEVLLKFNSYKEFRGFMDKDQLQTGTEATLYKANELFLEYYSARPKFGDLTAEELRFEKYFTDAADDADKAIQTYWEMEGFQNYTQLIANPREKLAYTDIAPLIKKQNQALIIYDHGTQTVIHNNAGSDELPKLEITLEVLAGHYHLLKTDETASLTDEYEKSLKQYMKDREDVLATRGNKDAEANKKSSLLVGAICPSGHLKNEPFTLLLDKIDGIKSFITNHQQAEALKIEQEKQRAKVLEEQCAKKLEEQRVKELEKQCAKKLEVQRAKKLEKKRAKKLEKRHARELEEQHARELEEQHARELEEQHARELEEQSAKKIEQDKTSNNLAIGVDLLIIEDKDLKQENDVLAEEHDSVSEERDGLAEENTDLRQQQQAAVVAVVDGEPKPTEGFMAQFVNAIKYLYEEFKNAIVAVAKAIGIMS